MKKKWKKNFLILVFSIFGLTFQINAIEKDCQNVKKFTVKYMNCKANLIKDNTISGSKNIIKDTKDYQKKVFTGEKQKINKVKRKF